MSKALRLISLLRASYGATRAAARSIYRELRDEVDWWVPEIFRCEQLVFNEVFNVALADAGIDGLRQPGRQCCRAFFVSPLADADDRHAALLLDQAGWHTSTKLHVPDNITIVPLPPKCPELLPPLAHRADHDAMSDGRRRISTHP